MLLRRKFQFTVDRDLHIDLKEKCRTLNVTVAHFVRCALIPDGADDLAAGAEPDASGIPHPMPIHRGEATEKRIVCILLSPAEHEVVVRWAIHEGMTMAALARMAIAVMIEKEDVRDRIEEPEWSLDRKCRSLLEEIGAPQGDAYTTRQVSGKHLRR